MKEPDWWDVVDYPFLGERAEHEYPVKSFLDAGAVVVASSDHWVTPIPNPLWALETYVTRNLNNAEYYGVDDITDMDDPTWLLDPSQRITWNRRSAHTHPPEPTRSSWKTGSEQSRKASTQT
jgi:hypothetical protein